MKLFYNNQLEADSEIKNRMEDMTLAFEKVEHFDEIPRLIDGKVVYSGIKKITKHLDSIAGELHSWYYCNC